MAVKTDISLTDIAQITAVYPLSPITQADPISAGTVQTNYLLHTAKGKFVLRVYENRSRESVLFEQDLLLHLQQANYPAPTPLRDSTGQTVQTYLGKPLVLYHFIVGEHVAGQTAVQFQQLTQWAAKLQRVTQHFHSPHLPARWNLSPELCRQLAAQAAKALPTSAANAKLAWLEEQLASLTLPDSLPKAICHCDFHFANVLFRDDQFVALLDFDDANWTYATFDLVGLIEQKAWSRQQFHLSLPAAREIVQQYTAVRPLTTLEQQHLFDVYKLSILFDCVWFFARGAENDFFEKRKIELLDKIGRTQFYTNLFSAM